MIAADGGAANPTSLPRKLGAVRPDVAQTSTSAAQSSTRGFCVDEQQNRFDERRQGYSNFSVKCQGNIIIMLQSRLSQAWKAAYRASFGFAFKISSVKRGAIHKSSVFRSRIAPFDSNPISVPMEIMMAPAAAFCLAFSAEVAKMPVGLPAFFARPSVSEMAACTEA